MFSLIKNSAINSALFTYSIDDINICEKSLGVCIPRDHIKYLHDIGAGEWTSIRLRIGVPYAPQSYRYLTLDHHKKTLLSPLFDDDIRQKVFICIASTANGDIYGYKLEQVRNRVDKATLWDLSYSREKAVANGIEGLTTFIYNTAVSDGDRNPSQFWGPINSSDDQKLWAESKRH